MRMSKTDAIALQKETPRWELAISVMRLPSSGATTFVMRKRTTRGITVLYTWANPDPLDQRVLDDVASTFQKFLQAEVLSTIGLQQSLGSEPPPAPHPVCHESSKTVEMS